jgi:hypothetical protein
LIKAAIGDDPQLIADAVVALVKANDLITGNWHEAKRIFGQLLLKYSPRTKLGDLHTDRLVGSSDFSEFVLQSTLNLSILLELILQINIRQPGGGQNCCADNYLKDRSNLDLMCDVPAVTIHS